MMCPRRLGVTTATMGGFLLRTFAILSALICCSLAYSDPIQVRKYCGYTKGCLMFPEGCTSMQTCQYLLTFKVREEDSPWVDFEMSAHVDQEHNYVAMAFSEDKVMGRDSTVECVHSRLHGTVQVFNGFNEGKTHQRLPEEQLGLENLGGTYENGILRCKFSRLRLLPEGNERFFDLNEKWFLLMTKGNTKSENGVTIITAHSADVALKSKDKVDTRAIGILALDGCDSNILIRIHGVLMVVAWVGCISTGILVARFFKFTWPKTTCVGEAVWFQVHRGLHFFALLCIIVAIIIIFVAIGGWIDNEGSLGHAICGIIAASFAVLQPFMALCRCHPGTKNRPIFNWFHWLIGTLAHILAFVAIFLAVDIPKTCLDRYVDYIMVAFVIFHVIVEILLEIHACCYRNSNADTDELIMKNYGQFMTEREREEVHGSVFQQALLAIYVLVVVCVVAALVIIILLK